MKPVIFFPNDKNIQTEVLVLVFTSFSSNVLVDLRFNIEISFIYKKYYLQITK
jgi:hypothetical protein